MSFLSIRESLEQLIPGIVLVSRAESASLGKSSKPVTLLAVGTTPSDTKKRTYTHNARDVIFTSKALSICTEKLLSVSSEEELRTLCNELNELERTLRKSTPSSYSTISSERITTRKVDGSTLTPEELIELRDLRKLRLELLTYSKPKYKSQYNRLEDVKARLYEITGRESYLL